MEKLILGGKSKHDVFEEIQKYLNSLKLRVAANDFTRPWGGFFVIDESQAEQFVLLFFPGVALDSLRISGKLSPKILVVEPGKRLSWQYHLRRAEIWRCIAGTAGVVTSTTDEEKETTELTVGDEIRLTQGERHRLIGLEKWAALAEIWQHTDEANPSDESDIIRVQDDFGR